MALVLLSLSNSGNPRTFVRMLRISVITICFNNLKDLQSTLISVDAQHCLPFEHIIINGSSNSEIDDWLHSNPQPNFRRWVSEKDKGISDAFNKGIQLAKGDVIHLLNAGDMYYDEKVLEYVSEAFEKTVDAQWLHGKFIQFRGGVWVTSGKAFDKDLLYRGMRTVGHPTMFIKRELYQLHGIFDLNKKIAMDYDFLLRIREEPFIFLPQVLIRFSPDGVSERSVQAGLTEVEESYQRIVGIDPRQKLWILRILLLNGLMNTSIGKTLFKIKNRGRTFNAGKN